MEEDLSTREEQTAIYENLAKRAVENLKRRGIEAYSVRSKEEARSMCLGMIPKGAVIGTADSATLLQVGVFSALKRRGGNEILNPFVRDDEGHLVAGPDERQEMMRKVLLSDIYICGTNAVTLDGKLVNTDAHGNRVAAMIFGPKKVIIMIGANKIVRDADAALKRIREICAPRNAVRHSIKHHRAEYSELPCVKTGVCSDCHHPWRICRYTTIIEGVRGADQGRISVILVAERLGI